MATFRQLAQKGTLATAGSTPRITDGAISFSVDASQVVSETGGNDSTAIRACYAASGGWTQVPTSGADFASLVGNGAHGLAQTVPFAIRFYFPEGSGGATYNPANGNSGISSGTWTQFLSQLSLAGTSFSPYLVMGVSGPFAITGTPVVYTTTFDTYTTGQIANYQQMVTAALQNLDAATPAGNTIYFGVGNEIESAGAGNWVQSVFGTALNITNIVGNGTTATITLASPLTAQGILMAQAGYRVVIAGNSQAGFNGGASGSTNNWFDVTYVNATTLTIPNTTAATGTGGTLTPQDESWNKARYAMYRPLLTAIYSAYLAYKTANPSRPFMWHGLQFNIDTIGGAAYGSSNNSLVAYAGNPNADFYVGGIGALPSHLAWSKSNTPLDFFCNHYYGPYRGFSTWTSASGTPSLGQATYPGFSSTVPPQSITYIRQQMVAVGLPGKVAVGEYGLLQIGEGDATSATRRWQGDNHDAAQMACVMRESVRAGGVVFNMTLITDDIAGTQLYGGPLTFSNQRYYNPSLIHGYPAASTANAITAMSQSGSTVTVTVASMPALKYSVALIPTNQQIVITGAAVAGYNGVWPIIADAVPGVNGTVTFTANQTGLGATATGTMTYYLGGAFNWTPKPSAAVGLQFEQCMKGNRVRVSINGSNPNPGDVDGIAFCSSSQFGLMLYNLNIGCSTGGANYYDAAINRSPTITITNLPFSGSRTLNVYRLDSSNGNLDGLIQAGTTPTYTYATGVGNTTAQNTVVNGSVTVTSGSCTITGAIYGTLPANSVVFIQIT